MAAGRISPTLPYIKRDSVALLNGDYPSVEVADKAFDALRSTYAARYPLVLQTQGAKVTRAIDELKTQYRLIATPAMKVQAKTYPDNLGHQGSPGCFRCHDGAHFLVEKGRLTKEKIPSECSTCHTFPQIGPSASSFPLVDKPSKQSLATEFANLPLGSKPATHKDDLYVFNHKNAVSKLEPAGTTCAACHTRAYCVDCHNSGAVNVKHDNMLYNHASAITAAGGLQACAYCHQEATCALCHAKPVLGTGGLLPAAVNKVRLSP